MKNNSIVTMRGLQLANRMGVDYTSATLGSDYKPFSKVTLWNIGDQPFRLLCQGATILPLVSAFFDLKSGLI